jgi:hypothetical protein
MRKSSAGRSVSKLIQWEEAVWCGASTGTANAQVLTPYPAISEYVAGMRFKFYAGNGLTNTGACTIDISGLGPISIYDPNWLNTALFPKIITQFRAYELLLISPTQALLVNPLYDLSTIGGLAATGTNQAGALQLTHKYNLVTSSTPASAYCVKLLPALAGMKMYVALTDTDNDIEVWPSGAELINTVNASFVVLRSGASTYVGEFECFFDGRWSANNKLY